MAKEYGNAPMGKRIAATVIDYVVMYLLFYVYVYLAGEQNEDGVYAVHGLSAFGLVLIWFIYFVGFEAFVGGTIGHNIFQLKIMSTDGGAADIFQVFLRRIADAVEIAWCFGFVAFIIARSNPLGQRLGDMWAKTRVVGG